MIKTSITPRVSETDGVGHINNAFVPVWFEAGRREIFRIFSPDLSFDKWRMALVNMNVDFEGQFFYQADVEIRTWIERTGTKSFTVGEELWQNGKRCARGTAVYVNFDYHTQSAEAMSVELIEQLAVHKKED